MINNFKSILHKKKRQIYNSPNYIFKKVFWEDNVDNRYYGHYQILKKYSKTALPYKINGEVQHGWSPNSGITSENSSSESIKKNRFYLFNEENKKKALNAGYKNIVIIGSPFIYMENLNQNFLKKIPNSLICFPTHNHEWAGFKDTLNSYQKYCTDLLKISKKFKKITISLFWKEYEDSNIKKVFKDHGFSIVTMGPRDNNPNFLHRFVKIVSEHEYLSSDSFSSAVFYGLYLKKKVFIYSRLIYKNQLWGKENENAENELIHYKMKYPELLWQNFEDKSYYRIGEKELGSKFKLSPREMRKMFGWKINNLFFKRI